MQKHYIDIFDDGLYENDADLDGPISQEAMQLIRIQSLWAILFDGQVIVPEQWAISSPAFFDLAAEVGNAFETYLRDSETSDIERARAVAAPPLVIGLSPMVANYQSALIDRLTTVDRPIQGLQRLNINKYEDAASIRMSMAKAIGDWRTAGDPKYQAARLAGALATMLDSDKLGVQLAATIGYSSQIETTMFHAAPYEPAFGLELRRLRQFVFTERPLNYVFGEDIRLLRKFFLHLDQEQIALSNPSRVIRLLASYSDADRDRLLHIGRICVHNALANITKCTVGSITYDTLTTQRMIDFDRVLVDETGLKLRPEHGEEPDLGAFEQTFFYGRQSDVHRFIEWNLIWPSVFRLSYSPKWAEQRKKIAKRIAGLPLQKQWHHETWDELFDMVTSKLATIELRRDRNDPSAFRIGLSPKSLKHVEEAGNILMATSTAVAASPLSPAISIPIGALGALCFGLSKALDARLITKAVLGGRRIARKIRPLF